MRWQLLLMVNTLHECERIIPLLDHQNIRDIESLRRYSTAELTTEVGIPPVVATKLMDLVTRTPLAQQGDGQEDVVGDAQLSTEARQQSGGNSVGPGRDEL